jgi:DNA-binding transcriptional LysR family regulator
MQTELKSLRYFATLADTLSFTVAANKLGMTQPALSIAMQRLEERVGVELLRRTSRHVILTPAGEAYARGAREILALVDQVERTTAEVASGQEGLCRIGFVQSASFDVVPPILRSVQDHASRVRLQLSAITSIEQLRQLIDGQLDIGLVRQAVHGFADVSLTLVHEQRMVAALPATHRLASNRSLPLSALRNEVFLMVPDQRSPAINARVRAACEAAGYQPRASLEAVEMATILSFVGEGLGVALLPANCRRFADRTVSLIDLEDANDHLNLPLYLAHRKVERDLTVRRIIDIALRTLARLQPRQASPLPSSAASDRPDGGVGR